MDTSQTHKALVVFHGEPSILVGDGEVQSNYTGYDELNWCSSIDEEELVHNCNTLNLWILVGNYVQCIITIVLRLSYRVVLLRNQVKSIRT